MLAGHRWERDFEWLGYRCVGLPLDGVESHQRCVGCGCKVSDLEVCKSQLPSDGVYLDLLARNKGYEPKEDV